MKYRKDESYEEAFNLLKASIAAEENESGAADLFNYVKASAMMYNDDKIDKLQLIGIYQNTMEHINYNLEFGRREIQEILGTGSHRY